MSEPMRVSAWTKASKGAEKCPNTSCLAENRPGVHFIDVIGEQRFCNSCALTWYVRAPERPCD